MLRIIFFLRKGSHVKIISNGDRTQPNDLLVPTLHLIVHTHSRGSQYTCNKHQKYSPNDGILSKHLEQEKKQHSFLANQILKIYTYLPPHVLRFFNLYYHSLRHLDGLCQFLHRLLFEDKLNHDRKHSSDAFYNMVLPCPLSVREDYMICLDVFVIGMAFLI